MTTGNKSESNLTSFVDYYGQTVYYGSESSRRWTGTDYPSRKPKYTNVYYHGTNPPRKVWAQPPKRARSAEHPYTCSYSKQKWSKITYNITIPHDPFPPEVTVVNLSAKANSSFTDLWTSNDDNKLLDKLREKLMGSDFNAGVAIAESSKSLGLITNSATRIALALKAARSGRLGDAAIILTRNTAREGKFKPPKDTPNDRSKWGGLWLELQYGWMPLLKDAEAGAKAYAHAMSAPLQQTYRARRQVNAIVDMGPNFVGSVEGVTLGSIKAIIREKDMPQLLGLMDPASIAWELTPYSFVVDWFVPIGNYLQNLALARGIDGTFVITKWRRVKFNRTAFKNAPGFPTPQTVGCSAIGESGSITRTVSTTLSVPLPNRVPLEKALSFKHCLNAIALLSVLNPKQRVDG